MLKILQGDDTAANGRTITLRIADAETRFGDGYRVGLSFCGTERSGELSPGASLKFDYTRAETARMPLGVHYASVWLEKDGLRQTFANNLQIKVTDSVEEADMALETHGNTVSVSVKINTGVPRVEKDALTKSSSIGEVKEVTNAILAAVNGSAEPAERP